MLPVAILSEAGKKRIRNIHPWIFSNEIEKKPEAGAGDLVEVHDREGKYLATGYFNPQTLIAIRILTFHKTFDALQRIQKALALRQKHYGDSVYRLIYSESDGLPGLIVDRYNETLVVQILTAGMEKLQAQVLDALQKVIQPKRILLRNDSPYRKLEGLNQQTVWFYGNPTEEEIIEIEELKFFVNFETGQKTGFFLDQRENRKRLLQAGTAESLLDVYAYTGAWSIYGAAAGIKNIIAVDSSEESLQMAKKNARINDYSIRTVKGDGAEFLRSASSGTERFARIVLDPPAFCKSKRHLKAAIKAYREINLRAMKCLSPDGILFTCSCSQPITIEIFVEILRQAAIASGRQFYLRELLLHPPDHPILLGFPESHYLKCAVLSVTPASRGAS
jgi:23S rRNA (cytosine1962-C5)-methyltransferase